MIVPNLKKWVKMVKTGMDEWTDKKKPHENTQIQFLQSNKHVDLLKATFSANHFPSNGTTQRQKTDKHTQDTHTETF